MGHAEIPAQFCWSRIGTESGEGIKRILARKDFERRANGGTFLWGVGNSVSKGMTGLFREAQAPEVIFSHMLSRPRAIDVSPPSVVAWWGAQDSEGRVFQLPAYSLITSRGGTSRPHYALVCSSAAEISYSHPQGEIEAATLVNLVSGERVGASQVTAVVRRVEADAGTHLRGTYTADIRATLLPPGQVRLVRPKLVAASLIATLDAALESGDLGAWKKLVSEARVAAGA